MTSERKLHLTRLIQKNPGLNFRDLMRSTGMKNGVLGHHLNGLEKAGIISVIRGPRQSRFYPPSFSEQESKIIKALRRTTPKMIIQCIILEGPSEFKDIVSFTNKSPSTVSLYLSQLTHDRIISTKLSEKIKVYNLNDRSIIEKLVDDYQPCTLDKPVSGLEDIINSL